MQELHLMINDKPSTLFFYLLCCLFGGMPFECAANHSTMTKRKYYKTIQEVAGDQPCTV